MSAENLGKVVARAVEDPKFRELLFSEPDKALQEFELTPEETATLKSLAPEQFDSAASELDKRISKNRLI